MKFSFEEGNNGSFLDVEVPREGKKFATTVYCKPTFSVFYMHVDVLVFHTWFSDVFNLFQLDYLA